MGFLKLNLSSSQVARFEFKSRLFTRLPHGLKFLLVCRSLLLFRFFEVFRRKCPRYSQNYKTRQTPINTFKLFYSILVAQKLSSPPKSLLFFYPDDDCFSFSGMWQLQHSGVGRHVEEAEGDFPEANLVVAWRHSFQGGADLKRVRGDGGGLQMLRCSALARAGAFLFFQSVFQFIAMSNQALSDN